VGSRREWKLGKTPDGIWTSFFTVSFVQKSETKILVAFGDLHCGSVSGLLKPGFVTHEENEIKLNPFQEWLWSSWLDCQDWLKTIVGKDPWACVVNGDLIDGNHHRTREIWSPDESDHAGAAVEVLEDFLEDAAEVYLTEGTNVHVNNIEHAIARSLSNKGIAVKMPKGKQAWPELRLEVSGTLCEVDHHMPTTMRSYLEAGPLSITLGDIRNQRARVGAPIPKVIIRSHRHRFGLYEDGYGMVVALPAWQGATRFTRRVVPGIVPQAGIVVLDWRKTEGNCTPVVHKRLHTLKP
jgi:hypothetical protein